VVAHAAGNDGMTESPETLNSVWGMWRAYADQRERTRKQN
jgi:hypothetical protein